MSKWLQYYIGGEGSLGTPKSDYVICARPHVLPHADGQTFDKHKTRTFFPNLIKGSEDGSDQLLTTKNWSKNSRPSSLRLTVSPRCQVLLYDVNVEIENIKNCPGSPRFIISVHVASSCCDISSPLYWQSQVIIMQFVQSRKQRN